jgi:hypothetical protein
VGFTLFRILIAAHILAGSIAAISFWVPVIGRKGAAAHRRWGRIFSYAVIATGLCAICLSLLTLSDPMTMHPHLVGRFDADFVRGIFGWMMLHNAILTINLGWYGWLCVINRQTHLANRTPLNLALQGLVMVAAVNCAWQGWLIGQPLMMAISVVGIATGITNLIYLASPDPPSHGYLKEHVKALIGAGISVYTAFLAFGSVRLMPSMALHPALWSVPLAVGLAIIIYHRLSLDRKALRPNINGV